MLTYHVFRPEEGMTEAGQALAFMLSDEAPGKSYADAMRARVAGTLSDVCTDTYFVALDGDECVSRLWYGWGTHADAIGNFGNFLTLEQYRGQGIGTRLLETWYANLQGRSRDADAGNGPVGTVGGAEGRTDWESGTHIYSPTAMCKADSRETLPRTRSVV